MSVLRRAARGLRIAASADSPGDGVAHVRVPQSSSEMSEILTGLNWLRQANSPATPARSRLAEVNRPYC
jgi:hypothetical protein